MVLTTPAPSRIDDAVERVATWMAGERFDGLTRLYAPRQVAEQRGTIEVDYPVARVAAERLHARLRQLFDERRAITTFGPYSPGQAVAMKWSGIEGIYIGGWATSAPTWPATRFPRSPTRRPASFARCSPRTATRHSPARA